MFAENSQTIEFPRTAEVGGQPILSGRFPQGVVESLPCGRTRIDGAQREAVAETGAGADLQGPTRHDLRRSAVRSLVSGRHPRARVHGAVGSHDAPPSSSYNLSDADVTAAADQLCTYRQQRQPARLVRLRVGKNGRLGA